MRSDSRSVPENEKKICDEPREKNDELTKWSVQRATLLVAAVVVMVVLLIMTFRVLSESRVGDDHAPTQFQANIQPTNAGSLDWSWMPMSGGDGDNQNVTSAPQDCPYAWKVVSSSSSEAIHLAQCGVDGLPKAQHMTYKLGRVFMAARQTLGETVNMRISAIIFRQKMVLPNPGKIVPVVVLMEVTKMHPHCGLKELVGMYAGLALNETSLAGMGHPHVHLPSDHHPHYYHPHHVYHYHVANPSGWRDISPQHIQWEARAAAKFAATKMTSTCAFEGVSHPQYQVMRDGFRFHMTVMVKNPSTGRTVPCVAEVHATVHAHYHVVKGHCIAGEGC